MYRILLFLLSCFAFLQAGQPLPRLVRIYPLGGQAGTSVPVEMLGDLLANATGVEFDCDALVWSETKQASHGKLSGTIKIDPQAALGPHLFRVKTLDGYSTSLMFNVGQFSSVTEIEPNDQIQSAQNLPQLPVELQGRLDGAPDMDFFSIGVQAGERWVFDLKSIEQGSAVEARMILLEADGRQVRFNDDRGDYDENPLIEYTFQKAGKYYVKVDQYRGPRGFNFGKNCAYILRISKLPVLRSAAPLGLEKGKPTRLAISGGSLQSAKSVYLTKVRQAEYAHMTYPYTMPMDFLPDSSVRDSDERLTGKIIDSSTRTLQAEFSVPRQTRAGLWKIWVQGEHGIAEGVSVEISDHAEYGETSANRFDHKSGSYSINGRLSRPGEIDAYRIQAAAGHPLHFWTLATQLGVPYIDTVLRLRDASGKKLAESDDVVAGQGTLIGNPDSSLYFTPQKDELLSIEVFDRLKRGGSCFEYRLNVKSERPSFQLFTTPENFAVAQGGVGEIKVHLVRETGFEGEVSVWIEGLPDEISPLKAKFRADQLFEPNADGADMVIPEITFKVSVPVGVRQGIYPLRVFGCATAEESRQDRHLVEGHTAMMLGPLLDVWNFVRRPMPTIAMSVLEPFDAKLLTETKTLRLEQGKTAELMLKLENVAGDRPIELFDLPRGVTSKSLGRKNDQETIVFAAATDVEPGNFPISATALSGNRRATVPLVLTVHRPPQ